MPSNLRDGMARLMTGCSPQGGQRGTDRLTPNDPPKRWALVSGGVCPTARSGHCAVVAGGKAYIFGGCGRPHLKSAQQPEEDLPAPVCLGDMHAFDLARQTWENINASGAMWPAVARTCAAMCANEAEDRLFLSGGANDDPDDLRADLLEFDLRSRTWSQLFDGSSPTSSTANNCRRIGHSIVHDVARNRLVIFGGSTGFEYFDDTSAFNLADGVWESLVTTGDRPSPRYKHQAFVDSDAMYVVGGGSFEPEGRHLDVYRLYLGGPRANEWERVRPTGDPPRCRAAHGLSWDREARTAYIWGGFTMGMELDSSFHALRLPPLPNAQPTATAGGMASATPVATACSAAAAAAAAAAVSAAAVGGGGHGGARAGGEVSTAGDSHLDQDEECKTQELAARGWQQRTGERWWVRQDWGGGGSREEQQQARGARGRGQGWGQGWGSGRRRQQSRSRQGGDGAVASDTSSNDRGALSSFPVVASPAGTSWVTVPDREWGWAPCPAGRSFHCAFFHDGACYVTGGSDGSRKFGDMWRYTVRETPPPLATLAARAVSAAAARRKEGGGRGGGAVTRQDLPEEVRKALATLNMQARVVL